jgi:hypothetical protein
MDDDNSLEPFQAYFESLSEEPAFIEGVKAQPLFAKYIEIMTKALEAVKEEGAISQEALYLKFIEFGGGAVIDELKAIHKEWEDDRA